MRKRTRVFARRKNKEESKQSALLKVSRPLLAIPRRVETCGFLCRKVSSFCLEGSKREMGGELVKSGQAKVYTWWDVHFLKSVMVCGLGEFEGEK